MHAGLSRETKRDEAGWYGSNTLWLSGHPRAFVWERSALCSACVVRVYAMRNFTHKNIMWLKLTSGPWSSLSSGMLRSTKTQRSVAAAYQWSLVQSPLRYAAIH